jgi:hypothetical protein
MARDIRIVTSNTPPALTLNSSGALVFTEKNAATAIAPAVTIADPDSPNIQSATVKFTSNFQSGQDKLVFATIGNINGTFDNSSGTLTLNGADTLANYQAALQSVKYFNSNNNPSVLTRSVSFLVSDGLSTSNVVSRNITVQPVNDPPLVQTNATGALAYKPANGAVAIAAGLTVTDADSDNLVGATVQISFNYERSKDVLSFVNTAKITGSFNVATGVLTLTGSDTVSNYRSALRTVMYAFNGTPIASTKTISFVASDGSALSTPANRDIMVSP